MITAAAATAATAATGIATLALVLCERRDSRLGRRTWKPLASAGFLGTALLAGAAARPWGRLTLLALALSAVGDLLLLGEGERWFLGGLGAFFAAHVAFAAAFLQRGVDPRASIVAALVLVAPAMIVARWLLPHVERPMRAPVVGYMAAITAMVALAIGTAIRGPGALLLAGAIAFYLSDLSVARDTFVTRGFANRAWGLPTYYAAQLALAWSAGVG